MSEINRVEAGFARHHVPLSLMLGVLHIARQIRETISSSGDPGQLDRSPSELDELLLGILAIQSRTERFSLSDRNPSADRPDRAVEGGILR